ncbi:MAG: prolipoprotein diacylglyceryl transferase [Bacteroidota bacterium]|nr:prolipoprotein diacylglyceryl transferase [Bacteroidota bacterium]
MSFSNIIEKLKQRWQVNSAWQVLIILIVFACTGYSIIGIKHLIGITADTDLFYRILFYILVLPIYNVLLLMYGFIFGQFKFFLAFEKRFFKRIIDLFVKKK